MVDIHLMPDALVVKVLGLHQLWAFKREIRIPRAELRSIEVGVAPGAQATVYRSLRLPGTFVPRLIRAGSYRGSNGWLFWDIAGRGPKAVTLTTQGHRYAQLVVDVADPHATVERVRRGLGLSAVA